MKTLLIIPIIALAGCADYVATKGKHKQLEVVMCREMRTVPIVRETDTWSKIMNIPVAKYCDANGIWRDTRQEYVTLHIVE